MWTKLHATHLGLLIAAAALVAASAAPAAEAARSRPLKLQGTWQGQDDSGSGTWAVAAQVHRPEILRGEGDPTAWESFSGTLRAAGVPDLADGAPVTGWMVEGTIAIRIQRSPWDGVIMVGAIDGARVSGRVAAPDGRILTWQGWWIAPKPAPAPAGNEPRLSAAEED